MQQVFKKLNLHHEVHTPDPAETRVVTWEEKHMKLQRVPGPSNAVWMGFLNQYVDIDDPPTAMVHDSSTWWTIRRSKCTCCKRVIDLEVLEKSDKKPLNPTGDKPIWEIKAAN